MFKFQRKYLTAAILLFFLEVFIALFARDQIIRPYGGDLLVVILLYCLIKSFVDYSVNLTALSALLFSYFVETLQFFNLVYHLGLADSRVANILTGNSFSWFDILAYTLGILLVILVESPDFQIVE